MHDYAEEIVALVKAKNPAEPEFHQAVLEVVESTSLVIERHPEYRAAKIMERISQRISSPRIQWPSRTRPTTDPYGTLVQVTEDGEPVKDTTFLITMNELTFGADPKQAVLVLDNPSTEPLHARLWRTSEGVFYLEDSGSVAGTWVNYAPVAANGTLLHHGDLIHIGKTAYRFNLSHPKHVRKPVVTTIEEKSEKDEE